MTVQAVQEAKARSDAASAEVQRIHKEVTRLEVAIPKLQLEAAAARQQATDLQHRLAQLSSAAQVSCPLLLSQYMPSDQRVPLQSIATKHQVQQRRQRLTASTYMHARWHANDLAAMPSPAGTCCSVERSFLLSSRLLQSNE